MVTAELAACLPVLVLLIAFAIGAVSVADERARLHDAALAAARAYARGDAEHARTLAAELAPGSDLDIATANGEVTVTATRAVRLVPGVAPITVTGRAVAALEPGAAP